MRLPIWLPILLFALVGRVAGEETVTVPTAGPASFRIAPMTIDLAGRPGQVLPFEFEVTCGDRSLVLDVRVAGMLQEESGELRVDEAEVEDPTIVLDRPGRLALRAGERAKIRGRAPVRAEGASYRNAAILISQIEAAPTRAAGTDRRDTRLEVGYRLRYLARVDLHVDGVRDPRLDRLRLGEGGLVDKKGLALASVRIANPTPAAFEIQGCARIRRAADSVPLGPEFPLVLSVNSGRAGKDRLRNRVLPGAVVLLQALVPEPIPPGEYVLSVEVKNAFERLREEYPVTVGSDDFPAQKGMLPRVVGAVEVGPPRVALGLLRGAPRIAPVCVTNRSGGAVEIVARVCTAPGGPEPSWLVVRPDRITLEPGQSRRLAVMARVTGDPAPNRYASLELAIQPKDGSLGGELRVPVALSGTAGDLPELVSGEIRRVPGQSPPVYRVAVANRGAAHLPLEAALVVSDAYGRKLEEVPAGFGEWLLPGEEGEILFRLPRELAPGSYRLRAAIRGGPSLPDQVVEEVVEIP